MSYSKRNNLIKKNSTKTAVRKLVLPGTSEFAKNQAQTLLQNEIFQAIYLY